MRILGISGFFWLCRFWSVLTMVYNTRNYSVSGIKKKHTHTHTTNTNYIINIKNISYVSPIVRSYIIKWAQNASLYILSTSILARPGNSAQRRWSRMKIQRNVSYRFRTSRFQTDGSEQCFIIGLAASSSWDFPNPEKRSPKRSHVKASFISCRILPQWKQSSALELV
jgi:hypothetical protein